MKDFDHPNVLTLIGITMDKGEFPMVILPFMHNGALLTYIRDENNVGVLPQILFENIFLIVKCSVSTFTICVILAI
jgi:hypothetical protein